MPPPEPVHHWPLDALIKARVGIPTSPYRPSVAMPRGRTMSTGRCWQDVKAEAHRRYPELADPKRQAQTQAGVIVKSCGSDEVAQCDCHGRSYGRPGVWPVVTCARKRLSARGFRITCRFASPAWVAIAARRSGRLRRR